MIELTITVEEYGVWKQLHCDLMLIHQPEFDAYLSALGPLFRRRKLTFEELKEASFWMIFALEAQGASWRDHARIIWGRVKALREQKAVEQEIAERRTKELALRKVNTDAIAGKIGKEKAS